MPPRPVAPHPLHTPAGRVAEGQALLDLLRELEHRARRLADVTPGDDDGEHGVVGTVRRGLFRNADAPSDLPRPRGALAGRGAGRAARSPRYPAVPGAA